VNSRLTCALIITCHALTACTSPVDQLDAADIVFVNAQVYTLDAGQPWADAVAIKGDSIVYVGDNEGAKELVGESTKRVDVGGQLLLPGFIDTHVHVGDSGAYATILELDTSGTVEEWVQAIADYAAAHPDQEVIYGYGFLASAFGMQGPTRQLIDAVVPDRPVFISDEGMHLGWANTATLRRLNITQDTPDPEPGVSYYKREENGDATGFLLEDAENRAIESLGVRNEAAMRNGVGIIMDKMNEYGVTAAFDAGTVGAIAENTLRLFSTLEAEKKMTLRVVGSTRADVAADAPRAVAVTDEWRKLVRGRYFHFNTLKITDDGTVEGRTAAMFEDYQGEPGHAGATFFTEEQMTMMVSGAAQKNIDVHIHALGERAVHESLNAVEAARKANPDSETRYALTHIQVVSDGDLARFGELDVMAQSTPLWASYDTYGEVFVSEDQFQRFWRFQSIEDAGGRLTFGSDYPASGAGQLGLSPLMQIEIGHTRQYPGEPDAPVQPRASERLSIASLVRGFTLNAAYQLHMEDEIGSIEVGKKADLIILDRNIFEVDPYTIHKTAVVMTVFDGNIIHEVAK
jgi:predicted amidohydrolase YtcJ